MITPYVTFAGDCAEALNFYKIAFNSEIEMLQTYGEYVPDRLPKVPENLQDWILHAEMTIGGTVFWFADEVIEPVVKGNMVKLTLKVSSLEDGKGIYDILKEEAKITLPPTETFYSTFHAGLIDKYGVSWNIVAEEMPKA